MRTLDAIAEERIREAQARGEFDDLPGAGAPLELGDDINFLLTRSGAGRRRGDLRVQENYLEKNGRAARAPPQSLSAVPAITGPSFF